MSLRRNLASSDHVRSRSSTTLTFPRKRVELSEQPQRMLLDIPARTVMKVLALLLVFAVGIQLLLVIRHVMVWVGTALFLAVALNPAVSLAERRMRRSLAVAVVFLGFLVGLAVVLALLVAPLVTQIDDIVRRAPVEARSLAHDHLVQRVDRQFHLTARLQSHASDLPRIAFGAAGTLLSGVTAAVTVLFLTFFTLLELPRMGALITAQLRPPAAHRARRLGAEINRNVGGYVAGNLLISVIAAAVATVSMWLLGVPYALTLGVVVGVGDLIPLVGATLASVIVIAVALVADGTGTALALLAVITVYQQVENHLIQPIVYRRTVQLPALAVLIAVLSGAALLGILGALVAIPVAGTVYVVVRGLLDERAARISAEAAEHEESVSGTGGG
ncbi:MAG: AI-2E family transporter [Gaiellales bacterium]